jgi:xylitol oxidase
MSETNWAGNVTYRAAPVLEPVTLDEVQTIVAGASNVRVVGTRHAFNACADAEVMLSLARMPAEVQIDRSASTVTCGAGMRYGDLAAEIQAHGLALHNLASLPHISVGGAIATGTHGSGNHNGSLATAVVGLEVVRSDGEVVHVRRGEPDFEGMVVGLGALGALTRVTLGVEPTYEVSQRVYERLAWEDLARKFDAIAASGYSVSLFTDWGESVNQVWVKRRGGDSLPQELYGARAAERDVHPLPRMDAENCTPQLGVPGTWWERLPHFLIGAVPSSGDELQAEYMLPRERALVAIDAVRGLAARIRPLLKVAEIRTVAADNLWMSEMYGRDTVCLHFTWVREQAAVEAVLVELEAALEPFEPRPHWGKLFMMRGEAISARYERVGDFLRLVERMDPRGAFRNPWFEAHLASR